MSEVEAKQQQPRVGDKRRRTDSKPAAEESLEQELKKTKEALEHRKMMLEKALELFGMEYDRLEAIATGKSTLRTRLDEHISKQGYDGYGDFATKVDNEGIGYYYESYTKCDEFISFEDFSAGVGLARELKYKDEEEE